MERSGKIRTREGKLPIPIGGVVTVAIDRVDRGHNDAKRLPGVVVDMMVLEDRRFYTVACSGGVLKTKYLRNDLIYEVNVRQDDFDLQDVFTNWKLLKVRMPSICICISFYFLYIACILSAHSDCIFFIQKLYYLYITCIVSAHSDCIYLL